MPLFFAMKHKLLIKALIATFGFIIVGWLSFMQPDWLLDFSILIGVCGYALLFLLVTPLGGIRLGESLPSQTFSKWLLKLLLGQFTLLILTIACIVAYFTKGPEYTLDTVNWHDFKDFLTNYMPWQWGPFPWSVIGIWGAVIAYVTHVQRGEPYLYQAGRHFYTKRFEPMLKTYVESTAVGANMLLISLLVCAVTLLFTYAVDSHFNIFHFKMPIITVIVLSFLGPLASLGAGRKLFRWLCGGRSMTLNRVMLVTMGLMVPMMILAAFAAVQIVAHRPNMMPALLCKECGNYFANVPADVRLAAIYWGWWFLWTPLAGSYLAKISQGRTLREFVVGLYAVPCILAVAWAYFIHYPQVLPKVQLPTQWMPVIFFALGLLTLITMLLTFFGNKDTNVFISGFMRPSQGAKTSRLWLKDASKATGIHPLSGKLLMAMIGTLFLHTTAGWYGIQFQVAAMGALVMNAVYLGFNLGVYQLWRDRKTNKIK